MNIKIKKNGYLFCANLKFKCTLGKRGLKLNKKEGDKSTPKGIYSIGHLYYRKDRVNKFKTKLRKKIIKKNMGWCHNSKHKDYNREIKIDKKKDGEKLFRYDHKYDLFIVINYNMKPTIPNKGSAIFLHLTNNYQPTNGCVAIKIKDFLKLLRYTNKNTKISIS